MEGAPQTVAPQEAEVTTASKYDFTTPEVLLADMAVTEGRIANSLRDLRSYREKGQNDKFEIENDCILNGLLDRIVTMRAIAKAKDVTLPPKPEQPATAAEQAQQAGKTTTRSYGRSQAYRDKRY